MTNKFIWEDKYSVGIESIDVQHKHFFEIANNIVDLLEKKDVTREVLRGAISELEDYAFMHLKTEETYFDTLHYQYAQAHIVEHELYRKKVEYYQTELDKPDADLPLLAEEVANYSIYWLSMHIIQIDKQYTVFFKEHGIN